MKILKPIFWLSFLIFFSCENSDENLYSDSVCDQITTISSTKYRLTESTGFSIRSVNLTGDCLEVELESGGCNGDSWEVTLIDADRVEETSIQQRDLKIIFKNDELCNAIVFRTFSFDLRPIQTSKDKVLLNLSSWEEQILYEY